MHPLLQIAALGVVAWLPGAALFRVPRLDRGRRAQLDAEERAFWAVILSLGISLAIALALAALDHYRFERLLIANGLLAGAIALLWRRELLLSGARRITVTAAIPLALIVVCGWRFFPPAEYAMGGKDPGVYFNEGIQLAQRGALIVHDPVVAAVPPFARDLFMPRYLDLEGVPRIDYYSTRFMGFFIKDPEAGTVVGQFPHLFPASIAISYGIDGLTGARRTTGVWALLGVLSLYFAGARLFGRLTAAAAATLLGLHVVQLWFARYPNSEVVMQALLFAVLLANARAHVDGDRFFAPVAGGLLGLMLFLRFDSVLVMAAVGAAAALNVLAGRRLHVWFVLPLAAAAALATMYLLGPLRAYVDLYLVFLSHLPAWQYVALAMSGAGATWLLVRGSRHPAVAEKVRRWFPLALALLLIGAAAYALFLRQPGGRLAAHDAYALRTFANLYVSVPALLGALLGFWLLARTCFWRDPALFLTVALFSFFLFYKIRIVPEHFWMARRFVPVILPATLLFAAAAAFATASGSWRARLVRWSIGGVFIALLAAHYLRVGQPVLHHSEYEGLIPRLEALAAGFSPEDLILMEARDAGSDIHVFGPPLAFIYAKNVLLLFSARPDKATLAAFIEWARTKYRAVYFIGGGGTDLLSHRYGLRSVGSERFQVPEFETTREALPRAARRKEFEYGVYEFTPHVPRSDMWFDLDVGTRDDLHVVRFRAKEISDDRTFRWTGTASAVTVTTMPASAREVTLVMSDGGRPPAAPPAIVQVFLHNQLLGRIEVDGGFRPYTLEVSPELAGQVAVASDPVELRLVTTLWNPAEVLGSTDDRDLGVMVDRVTIK
jgi:hypothetical protein